VYSWRWHPKQRKGKQANADDREEKNATCQDSAAGKFRERLFDAVINNSSARDKQDE
jgi:hypothetical protein